MYALVGMPQGAEWLIILAIVVLLFGSAKLPQLVRQLGKSKKIWEEEVGQGKKGDKSEPAGELTEGSSNPPAQAPTQQPVQQPAQQQAQQPPNTQGNGPGVNGTPPNQS
jgi:sec-independent protein translocase protein TatA